MKAGLLVVALAAILAGCGSHPKPWIALGPSSFTGFGDGQCAGAANPNRTVRLDVCAKGGVYSCYDTSGLNSGVVPLSSVGDTANCRSARAAVVAAGQLPKL